MKGMDIIMKDEKHYICNPDQCTGCFACMNVCAKNAINIVEDNYGRTIPHIDENKCIDCNICRKICPVSNAVQLNEPNECYAIWTKNDEDRINCASGGISTGIARFFIRNHGVVFGAAFDDNLNLEIEMAQTEEELIKFRGSKYTQCSTGYSYRQVKEQLALGKEVLYVGTPCQIAGLYAFLQKPQVNLYTIDIICHGTPPLKYLKQYCEKKFPENNISNVTFRGENNYQFCAYEGNKLIYKKPSYLDSYFHAFLNGLTFRENCYSCKYAARERCSDLTIGDFWGIDKEKMDNQYEGRISVLLQNSDKGKALIDKVKDEFVIEKGDIEEAIKGNHQLQKPSLKHKERKRFLKIYEKENVHIALESFLKKEHFIWKLDRFKRPDKLIRKLIKL